jgi:hypothetical protein
MLQSRLSALDEQKVRIIRKQAELDELDALDAALAEINAEEAALKAQLVDIDPRQAMKADFGTVEDQLRGLVDTARLRMTNPTTETMVEVFDLLELGLVRVGDHRFEGTGNIPIPADGGEVWDEGPQRSS